MIQGFGPFSWTKWLGLATGFMDPDMPTPVIQLSEKPLVLFRKQGDSTVYRLLDGGHEDSCHNKAWTTWEEIIAGLLRAEWPGMKFLYPCNYCDGTGKTRVRGGHGDYDTIYCYLCNPDEPSRALGIPCSTVGFICVGPK